MLHLSYDGAHINIHCLIIDWAGTDQSAWVEFDRRRRNESGPVANGNTHVQSYCIHRLSVLQACENRCNYHKRFTVTFLTFDSSAVTLLSARVKLLAFLLRDSVHMMISFYGIKPNSSVTSLSLFLSLHGTHLPSDVYHLTYFWRDTDWTSCSIACIMKLYNPWSGWISYFIFRRASVQTTSRRSDISQEIFRGFVQAFQVNTVIISVLIIRLQPLLSTWFSIQCSLYSLKYSKNCEINWE